MKFAELKKMNEDDLRKQLNVLAREQFNIRLQKAVGTVAKPHRIREIRRDIAKIHTFLSQSKDTV